LATRFTAGAIRAAVNVLYRIEPLGLVNYSRSPSTLIVFHHRSDADGPIIASVLTEGRDVLLPGVLPNFVAREDMCSAGFLRGYLENWPWWIRELTGRIDVHGVLGALRASPMRRVRERSLGEVLADVRDVIGDPPLERVLRPAALAKLQAADPLAVPSMTVSQVLQPRHRRVLQEQAGLGALRRDAFRALKPYQRRVIRAQLQRLAGLLERGEPVQIAPEGVVSQDGRVRRPRAGLHTLINAPRAGVRVLPVGLSYDFMTGGRPRVLVSIGREHTDLVGLSRLETDRRVSRAIAQGTALTVTQLASERLLRAREEGTTVSWKTLSGYLAEAVACEGAAGRVIDPRLRSETGRQQRLRSYLRYVLGHGLLRRAGGGRYQVAAPPPGRGAGRGPGEDVIAYAVNELNAVRSGSWMC